MNFWKTPGLPAIIRASVFLFVLGLLVEPSFALKRYHCSGDTCTETDSLAPGGTEQEYKTYCSTGETPNALTCTIESTVSGSTSCSAGDKSNDKSRECQCVNGHKKNHKTVTVVIDCSD